MNFFRRKRRRVISDPRKSPRRGYVWQVLLCIIIVGAIYIFFNFFVFSATTHSHIYDYGPRYESHHDTTPLEDFFLDLYKSQEMSNEPFHAVVMPAVEGGDIGSDYMGLVNMILYSIFTKSLFFIPRKTFYGDDLHFPWMSFFQAKSFQLHQYIQFPPDNEILREKITQSNNHCFNGKVKPTDIFHYLQSAHGENGLTWMDKYRQKDVSRPINDVFRSSRIINDEISHELFASKEGVDNVFHEPLRRSEGFDFTCFHPTSYGNFVYHVFKSPPKVEFLCKLKLCEGIDLSQMSYEEDGHIRFGIILARNILQSLFRLNTQHWENELISSSTFYPIKGNLIGVHLKAENAGKNPQDIENCLMKVLNEEYERYKQMSSERGDVTLYLSSPDFEFSEKFARRLRIDYEQRKIFTKNDGFKNLNILTSKKLQKMVDEEEENDMITEEEKIERIRAQNIFFDLYFLSQSENVLLTQLSPFGIFAAGFGDSLVTKRPYYFPFLAGIRRSDFIDFISPCSDRCPYHPCPPDKCSSEYTG